MYRFAPVLFALALGCTASKGDDESDDSTGDNDETGDLDDTSDDVEDVDPAELNGTVPDVATPAPDFVATNRDGAARAREDLLGHPTVMWFYPAAATGG